MRKEDLVILLLIFECCCSEVREMGKYLKGNVEMRKKSFLKRYFKMRVCLYEDRNDQIRGKP